MKLKSHIWTLSTLCISTLLIYGVINTLTLLTELDHITINSDQDELTLTHPEPEEFSWVKTGQENIHLYEQLTQRYEKLSKGHLPDNQNNHLIIGALKNILDHLDNMHLFYETSPLKVEIKNNFLQQNRTRHSEWSTMLSKRAVKNKQILETKPHQDIVTITVTPIEPDQKKSEFQPLAPSYHKEKIKSVAIKNNKLKTRGKPIDPYRLLELSLGLTEE